MRLPQICSSLSISLCDQTVTVSTLLADQTSGFAPCPKLWYSGRIFWNSFLDSFSVTKHRTRKRSGRTVKVAFETRGPVDEPYLKVDEEQILGMTLRAGSMEIG